MKRECPTRAFSLNCDFHLLVGLYIFILIDKSLNKILNNNFKNIID